MEEREVISQELSHRIKNIFAVVAGLIQFAARARPEFAPAASDLRQRITALGRAHDFVRPHSAQSRPSAQQDSLRGLLTDLFEPYQQIDRERVTLVGDDLLIDDRSATPLALLFHELATNATKYGALSTEAGSVTLHIAHDDGLVTLVWSEHDGPAVVAPDDAQSGFGSQLIELSAVRQLGGTVRRDWQPQGLVATLTVPRSSFSRR
jgi:two-component sensor histidine kinase